MYDIQRDFDGEYPANSLVKGERYELTLNDTAADINGTVIKEGITQSFTAK